MKDKFLSTLRNFLISKGIDPDGDGGFKGAMKVSMNKEIIEQRKLSPLLGAIYLLINLLTLGLEVAAQISIWQGTSGVLVKIVLSLIVLTLLFTSSFLTSELLQQFNKSKE